MDGARSDAISLLANDPVVFALLIAAFLLLFWLKSGSGKILFFGLLILDVDYYYYTFVYDSDVLMYDYGLRYLEGIIGYTRYIGIILCWYAISGQAYRIRIRQKARNPSVAATSASNLPPEFQRNHDLAHRIRTQRAKAESGHNSLADRIRSERADTGLSNDKSRSYGRGE